MELTLSSSDCMVRSRRGSLKRLADPLWLTFKVMRVSSEVVGGGAAMMGNGRVLPAQRRRSEPSDLY